MMLLCLGAARAAHARAPAPVNLAAGKPVTQSSTANDGLASRAVDGNTDGGGSHGGSVTHTTENTVQPSWQVDLPSVREVGTVTLWNRAVRRMTFPGAPKAETMTTHPFKGMVHDSPDHLPRELPLAQTIREPDAFDTAARGTTSSCTAASASRPIEVETKRFGGSSSRGPSFVALAAHGAPP